LLKRGGGFGTRKKGGDRGESSSEKNLRRGGLEKKRRGSYGIVRSLAKNSRRGKGKTRSFRHRGEGLSGGNHKREKHVIWGKVDNERIGVGDH